MKFFDKLFGRARASESWPFFVKFDPKEWVIGVRYTQLDMGPAGADGGTSYRRLLINVLPTIVIVISWEREVQWDEKRRGAEALFRRGGQ